MKLIHRLKWAMVICTYLLIALWGFLPWELPAMMATAALGVALAALAIVITLAIKSHASDPNKEQPIRTQKFMRLSLTTTLLVYGLLLSGTYVVGSGASQACPSWLFCTDLPEWGARFNLSDINMLHRYIAIVIGLVMLWTLIVAWRRRHIAPGQAWVAVVTGLLFVAQSGVGTIIALWKNPAFFSGLHLALATAVWGGLVLLTALAQRQFSATPATIEIESKTMQDVISEVAPGGEVAAETVRVVKAGWRQTVSNYIDLMKPHVTVLLLGTTLAAMAIAYEGLPALGLVLATLLGGAMAAGSANCINCYIDRDIDQIMGRTQRRSLPAGRVQPKQALIFGILLGVASFIVLTVFVNLLSAVLACSAILFYVFVYTIGLKRSTAQNIVIGGAAGAVPVLVGWAAVTNSITLPAIWLFAIIFYWTPPHFWALSLLIQKDYEKAHVPMLPVVMGEKETRKQIFLYSLLLLAVTLVLFLMQTMGYVYLVGSVILGGIMVYMSIRLLFDETKKWARTIFWYSNCYLAAIFAIMVIDRVIF